MRRARANGVLESASLGDLPAAPDRDGLLKLLGVRAREGHVLAIRTLLDEYDRADQPTGRDPLAVVDELAKRRSRSDTDPPLEPPVGGLDREGGSAYTNSTTTVDK